MFEEVARNRKENYFGKRSEELSISEIERDYWSVTEESAEQRGLEVEYGNDLATSDVGSGFPLLGSSDYYGDSDDDEEIDQEEFKLFCREVRKQHANSQGF